MNEKVKAIFDKLGLTTEVITALSSTDKAELDKVDVDKIMTNVRETYKTVLKADGTFTGPIIADARKSARGELFDTTEARIMKLAGVTKEEYEALPKDKKFDSLMDFAFDKIKKTTGGTDTEKVEEIRKLNEKLALKDDEIKGIREKEIPELQKGFNSQLDDIHFNRMMIEALTPKGGDDKFEMVVKMGGAVPGIDNYFRNNFGYKLGEDKKTITLLQKGKDVEAFDGNKPYDFVKVVRNAAKELGYVKESNSGDGGGDRGNKGGDPGSGGGDKPKYSLPGLKKLEENAASYDKKD